MSKILLLFFLAFLYPIRFDVSSSIGFDSNYLRLSDKEKSQSSELIKEYGASDKVSSLVNRTKIGIKYYFDRKKKTFFVDASSRYSYYSNNLDKNYFSHSIYFSKKFKSYTFLKVGYKFMPEYYLRNFIDRDYHYYYNDIYPYHGCYFNQETVWIEYTMPAMKKTWLEIKAIQKSMLYNDRFNEYDLLISTLEGSLKTKLIKKYFFDVVLLNSKADNTTYQDGQISTLFIDRGYSEWAVKSSVKYSFHRKSFFDATGLNISIYKRKYSSKDAMDLLHIDRKHIDSMFNLWLKSKFHKFTYRLSIILRNRKTDSPYIWVEDLKSFKKYEVTFQLSYRLSI